MVIMDLVTEFISNTARILTHVFSDLVICVLYEILVLRDKNKQKLNHGSVYLEIQFVSDI